MDETPEDVAETKELVLGLDGSLPLSLRKSDEEEGSGFR